MKNYLLLKYLVAFLREYIFIFFTATIFLFILFTKSFSEENVFTINNVAVKGNIDLNFSREKYINKAFSNSFEILMNKILLSRDFTKVNNIKLKQIKSLINSFQILEESYRKDEYKATWFKYDQSVMFNKLKKGDYCELAVQVRDNFWKGKRTVSLQVLHANII